MFSFLRKNLSEEVEIPPLSVDLHSHLIPGIDDGSKSMQESIELLRELSALGYKNGPLLISKRKIYPDEVHDVKVAIPGKYTTANLLFSIVFPNAKKKTEYLFSDIVLPDQGL